MADDVVAIGGSKPGTDERFEALFRSEYENLAATPGTTERQVLRAFLRLWRRRWLVRDARIAVTYLRGGAGGPATAPGAVDVERAWREFQVLRSRGRRKLAIAAAGGGALILVAGSVLVVTAGQQPPSPSLPVLARTPRLPPVDPSAVTARIPLSGVIGVAAAGGRLWVARGSGWLVEVDPRTNAIGMRVRLGWAPGSLVAGATAVWLTTPYGRRRGQIERFDATTGRRSAVLHLAAGKCLQLAFAASSLWATCQVSRAIAFLRIDPGSGRVAWRSPPARWQYQYGSFLGPMTAVPSGVWYANGSGVAGYVAPGPRLVTVTAPPYTINLRSTASLVYSAGFVWAMAGDDGSVAKIDAVTGRVVRIYSRYPAPDSAMTVAQGSFWVLDNQDFAYVSVLRVSAATGRATGRAGGPRLCGSGQSFQIFATPGAIWVPCASWLARIDPAMPPASA